MFNSIRNNKNMILGAYKKLKSYYYYDKSMLFNKMRLATWEHPIENMEQRIDALAKFMCSMNENLDVEYLSLLLKQISVIPMPKAFSNTDSKENLMLNSIPNELNLKKINFYIKAPVELLILDTIWTLMIGKMAYENGCMPKNIFANRIKTKQVFNNNYDLYSGIDFESNRLFYPYFRQYSSWRDNAFTAVRKIYDSHQNSILISLDIKSYYYSVVFDFEQLPSYLNQDSRLKSIKNLTSIIKHIHILYTAEMQKFFDNIPADCKKGQSALPIGLISSMILSNLYLKDFDNAIRQKIKPYYYGRYVDDIIIVVKKDIDSNVTRDKIIEEILIQNNLVEADQESYRLLYPIGKLCLQKDKVRCIYFDHSEPDAMINLLCKSSIIAPSMSDNFLMPDLDFSKKDFDNHAYSIGPNNGTLKIRNFLFSSNNYKATLFMNDLLRASKNVNINEIEFDCYIKKQLQQIMRFYSSQQAIEFRSTWISIFSLILINKRYDYFLEFYHQLYNTIEAISSKSIDDIASTKLEHLLIHIKSALHEQLSIAVSIALAPHAINTVLSLIKEEDNYINYASFSLDSEIIISNSYDIRNTNMYNSHILAFPLLNYVDDLDNNVSLVSVNTSELQLLFSSKQLDKNKLFFSPRFIHLDELYFWHFLINFSLGGNPFFEKISHINEDFKEINQIKPVIENISEETIQVNQSNYIQKIIVNSFRKQKNIKAALASIFIDEIEDVAPVLDDQNFNLSPEKKNRLYKMLNDAKNKNAEIIVFPEFFMPIQWLQEILIFSRKNQIAILSGLRYLTNKSQAYNYIAIIQPFSSDTFKYSVPLFREKNYYAPAEMIGIAEKHLSCKNPNSKSTHLVVWDSLSYSNLMCYELTDIEYRYKLRGLINLLIVPELNRDTNYFSNMVESSTRDLHSFVIQVNTSKYGDSRITGPYNSSYKDIIKLKGGKDDLILTGTIDIEEIEQHRQTYLQKLQEEITKALNGNLSQNKPEKRKLKDPVAGFQKGGV